jgi:hypothetical protein
MAAKQPCNVPRPCYAEKKPRVIHVQATNCTCSWTENVSVTHLTCRHLRMMRLNVEVMSPLCQHAARARSSCECWGAPRMPASDRCQSFTQLGPATWLDVSREVSFRGHDHKFTIFKTKTTDLRGEHRWKAALHACVNIAKNLRSSRHIRQCAPRTKARA